MPQATEVTYQAGQGESGMTERDYQPGSGGSSTTSRTSWPSRKRVARGNTNP
jgi:hypothetical protein